MHRADPLLARFAASERGISVEEFTAAAAEEKIARDVEWRAAREKLRRILDRVPHVAPDPGDEL